MTKHDAVRGFVFAAGDLDGAKMSFLYPDGKAIKVSAAPSAHGTFMLANAKLPANFRVVATGGTMGGQAFTGSLKLDVSDYQDDAFLYMNDATTLSAAYRDLHPATTVAAADTKVKSFVGIGPARSLGSSLHRSLPEFDHGKFAAVATANGGFDAYVAKLASQIGTAGKSPKVRFPGVAANDAVDTAAEFVLKSALSAGANAAVNKVLISAGVQPDIAGDLDTLSSEVQDVDGQLKTLDTQLAQLALSVKYAQFTTLSTIETGIEKLDWAAKDPTDTTAAAAAECAGMQLAGESVIPAAAGSCSATLNATYAILDSLMSGGGGDLPLPEVWNRAYEAQHSSSFYGALQSGDVQVQYQAWQSLAAAQMTLMVNALNKGGSTYSKDLAHIQADQLAVVCDNGNIAQCTNGGIGTLAAYAVPTMPEGDFIQPSYGLMWTANFGVATYTYSDLANAIPGVNGGAGTSDLLVPSTGATTSVTTDGWRIPTEAEAKELFGALSGNADPGPWLASQLTDGEGNTNADTAALVNNVLGQFWTSQAWHSSTNSVTGSTDYYGIDHTDPWGTCPYGTVSCGRVTYELKADSTGQLAHQPDDYTYFPVLVRTLHDQEDYLPLNW